MDVRFSITLFSADDAENLATARALRLAVFCAEQGVPRELELDGNDHACNHLVLYDGDAAIATARVRPQEDGFFKIERMAVVRDRRGGGAGRAVMEHILKHLQESGAAGAVLHAQIPAEPFYLRCGFKSEGDIYEEAGIPHRTMRLAFDRRGDPK